jgi:LPPG:FO 2-phospho-L-lactate transferase
MTDDRVETHVTIADDHAPGGRRAVHFQEYWVRLRAEPQALAVTLVGVDTARPAAGVAEAVRSADLILIAPSNPVVSIGPILAVPDLRAELVRATAPVVGFAGILGGSPVLGMAHRLLPAIGVAVDAAAVGEHYGARSAGGVLDVWAMDVADADGTERVRATGLTPVVTDLIMSDPEATAAFIGYAVKSGTT